jgi:hypothetical protein
MNGRVLTAIVMLGIFLIMTLLALDFPTKARLMPLLIGIPAVLLGLVQLIIEYRAVALELTEGGKQVDVEKDGKEGKKDEKQMIMWITVFFITILSLGFIYAAPILVFSFLYFGSKESMKIALISSASTWLLMFIIFVEWFKISLFEGLIPLWLFG